MERSCVESCHLSAHRRETFPSTRGVRNCTYAQQGKLLIRGADYFDDTWLFNSSYPLCGAIPAATGPQCQTLRGGLYDPSVSSTSKAATDVYSAEAQPWDMQNSTEISYVPVGAWANDDLNVGNVTLAEYPLGMAGVDFGRGYITQVSSTQNASRKPTDNPLGSLWARLELNTTFCSSESRAYYLSLVLVVVGPGNPISADRRVYSFWRIRCRKDLRSKLQHAYPGRHWILSRRIVRQRCGH